MAATITATHPTADISALLSHWADGAADLERRRIERALQLWQQLDATHEGARAVAFATAQALFELHFDYDTIGAALLADLPPSSRGEDAKLRETFGATVFALVQGALRVASIEQSATGEQRSHGNVSLENLRKMLLAIASDVRVVVIALVRRAAVMRQALAGSQTQHQALARQTLDLFAPLANRLGMWQIKWELEDLAFRSLEPELYKSIARELDEKRSARESYIAEVLATLQRELAGAGINAAVNGRPKHIYSIHQKMQRKHVSLNELYDVRAVRVIVDSVKDCYTALGVVHNLWQPIAGEFDDYISQPKGNLYRSLHTAVSGPDGRALEVQIRTHDMHRAAELGIAAHWRYKEGGKSNEKMDNQIAWLRQVLNFRHDLAARTALTDRDAGTLFEDTVFVLTPQGKVIDLPMGATPVDFAYELHTDLGHRCRGAKVDGHIVPLNYKLQNAQQVEIISVKLGGPSRDWLVPALGYLHTARALAKVRQWFKQQEHTEQVVQGRSLVEKELQRAGQTGLALDVLAARLGFAKPEELYTAAGRGELSSRQIQLAIAPEVVAPPVADLTPNPAPAKPSTTMSSILVLGVDNIATQLAKCCKPLPPEPIVGFVTRGRGVLVHRRNCGNLKALSDEQSGRLMLAEWGGQLSLARFPVDVLIDGHDRQGLLRDVSDVFTREKVNVLGARTQTRGDLARMQFNIEVSGAEQLQRLLALLREVQGVQVAGRKL